MVIKDTTTQMCILCIIFVVKNLLERKRRNGMRKKTTNLTLKRLVFLRWINYISISYTFSLCHVYDAFWIHYPLCTYLCAFLITATSSSVVLTFFFLWKVVFIIKLVKKSEKNGKLGLLYVVITFIRRRVWSMI